MDCNQQILVETDAFSSTLCSTCGLVHINDGIYSFGFTIPAFKEWGRQILNLDYDHFYWNWKKNKGKGQPIILVFYWRP